MIEKLNGIKSPGIAPGLVVNFIILVLQNWSGKQSDTVKQLSIISCDQPSSEHPASPTKLLTDEKSKSKDIVSLLEL